VRLDQQVLVQVDQVVPLVIVQVATAVVLADLVRQAPVAVSPVRAHQVADQVVVRIQPAVVETQLVRLVNLAVGLQRVASQSEQSVKSSTT